MTSADRSWRLPETPDRLRVAFDAAPAYTVGIEDEVMLLEPKSLSLAPRADEVLALLEGDPRFKLELPASQLEIVTPPCAAVSEAAAILTEARRQLVSIAGEVVSFASAGVHPFSPAVGRLNSGPRYEPVVREYGWVAERELVCALQVHVSIGDSERALAVYNTARAYLPYLAALAANAPFYEGVDTGLASVRPKLAELLPRQGIPPALESWEGYLDALAWGATSGAFPDPATWWWELRLHPGFGTLEFRVPDGQSSVADAAAIGAVAQALVAWLGARHDAGEKLPVEPRWRIEENRWSACRYGVQGEMADLESGRRVSTRACLQTFLDQLHPVASKLGAEAELDRARKLTEVNGAIAQRQAARNGNAFKAAHWLVERFLDAADG